MGKKKITKFTATTIGPYPLTIVFDRYTGTYSGGLYTAWNLEPNEVPKEIYEDDWICCSFWNENEREHTFKVGIGSTPDDAIRDLVKQLDPERLPY